MSSFDQFSVVQAWLQSLYGEDSVPEFEISPETVNALFEVASASQRNTTNASLVMEAAKHQIELYKAKSSELSALITSVGLPTPQEISKSKPSSSSSFDNPERQILAELIRVIVGLSSALDIVTTSASSVMEAIGEIDSGIFTLSTAEEALSKRKAQIVAAYKETSELRQVLQRVAGNWDASLEANSKENHDRLQNLKYLDTKAKEYNATLQGLKDTLKKQGAHAGIYHGTLQTISEKLKTLESQNSEKQAQLEGFKQLPPDATLAKVKIDEAAAYLLQLEDAISRQVNQLQLHSDV